MLQRTDALPLTRRMPSLSQPVFHFPFVQFAELTLAANYSGMTTHFVDLCLVLFHERVKRKGHSAGQAYKYLNAWEGVRQNLTPKEISFLKEWMRVWEKGLEAREWTKEDLESVSDVCQSLVKTARNTVNTLYPFCGMIRG